MLGLIILLVIATILMQYKKEDKNGYKPSSRGVVGSN